MIFISHNPDWGKFCYPDLTDGQREDFVQRLSAYCEATNAATDPRQLNISGLWDYNYPFFYRKRYISLFDPEKYEDFLIRTEKYCAEKLKYKIDF